VDNRWLSLLIQLCFSKVLFFPLIASPFTGFRYEEFIEKSQISVILDPTTFTLTCFSGGE